MQDHAQTLGALAQDRERVLIGGASVDHQRLAGLASELDLGVKGSLLVGAGGVVPVVVKPGLPDRDALLVRGQRVQLGEIGVVEAGRPVRVPADRGVDLGKVLGRRERGAARGTVGPDRQQPGHPRLGGRGDELGVGRLAEFEMRVAVDHELCLGNSASSAVTRAPAPCSRKPAPV